MKEETKLLIKSWLNKAEKDLLTVEHEFNSNDPVVESICFHCQQSAEKFLKAYLIYLEIDFVKTHEIGELITLTEKKDSEIIFLKVESDKLTDYAVEIRYPDDFIELTLDDAEEARKIALKLKDYILNKIINLG